MNPIKSITRLFPHTVFKVVHKDLVSGELHSALLQVRQSKYNIVYKVGEIIHPQVGKIFSFLRKEEAFHWAKCWDKKDDNNFEIWRATGYFIDRPRHVTILEADNFVSRPELVESFWFNPKLLDIKYKKEGVTGTTFCDSICLTHRIE